MVPQHFNGYSGNTRHIGLMLLFCWNKLRHMDSHGNWRSRTNPKAAIISMKYIKNNTHINDKNIWLCNYPRYES